MAKLSILSALLILGLLLQPMAFARRSRKTRIRFFVHDIFAGPNRTFYSVAQSEITMTSPSYFGLTYVVDDPITFGPTLDSKPMGRSQGMFTFSDSNMMAPHMSLTFAFTHDKYKGSTLSVLGRNEISQKYRQLPIVGGTGAFELARGIVTMANYSVDPVASHLVLEYNLVIVH